MSDTNDVTLIEGFDHASNKAVWADHYGEWSRLREELGRFRSDVAGGYDLWYLLTYEDAVPALQDWQTFSSSSVQHVRESPQKMIPEELDPPEHTKYRQLLSAPLSPGNVAKMEDDIRATCIALIDELSGKGGCEFVAEFAKRFPTSVFLKFMGIPVEQTAELVELANTVMHTPADQDPDGAKRAEASIQMVGHFAMALAEKRTKPTNDLLTMLTQAKIDDELIPDEKLYAIGFLLYLAGLDTVANVLSYTISHLAQHPDLRRDLTANPDKWPTAIEEFLRLYTLPTTVRVVTKDVEHAGCPMKAGDRIVVPLQSLNRDPRQFPDADKFVPDRQHNRHVAFGAGPHRCVGSHLARLELKIAMEEWHKRIPDYSIPAGAVLTEHAGAVAGLDNLPLVW
jgi:cytochrome P450